MKTSTKRFIVLLMLLCMLLSSLSNAIADDDDWYTYTYSYWGEEMASPNAFAVTNVIFPATLDEELGRFSGATSLFCIDDLVFVCDTKNNRIVELRKVEGVYELVRIIYTVQLAQKFAEAMTYDGAVDNTLFNPTDIFVKKVTLEDRLTNYGEYRGDPYVFPDEAKTEETPADGEEKKDETAGEEEQKEAEETPTPTPEGGDSGEATPTPTEAPKAPSERKANVVRQELDREYDLYIADCQHCRVIHCDYDLNVVSVIRDPQDDTLGKDFIFHPEHLVTDMAYRTYVQAQGVLNGFMEFNKDGSFKGYMGAAKVVISLIQKLWRKLKTQEQRDRSAQFVPTEYNNLSVDSRGFIYATISSLEDQDIWDGTATPVRKLNAMGTDILIRNGTAFPMGDLSWGNTKGTAPSGASKFVDVIAFNNDTYCCLDKTRGKLFMYDFQGNLLYAFGNTGYSRGRFQKYMAISMDNLDEETILVLDSLAGSITEFTMTDYGRMINEALRLYKIGSYDESAEVWKRILQYNGNLELAYIGIGRALLRTDNYEEAMRYFENAHDSENYSKAYQHYREQVVEKYIIYFVVAIALLIIIPKVVRKVRKLRKEIREA